MTPKERADELVKKMYAVRSGSVSMITLHFAKQCALIAVDEILNTIEYSSQADELSKISYWEEVKNEINKL
jgi:hypothetical protein